ncbi:hypothetical protein ACQRUO_36575, partial [Kitasatospora sp. LaBMicrA B282]
PAALPAPARPRPALPPVEPPAAPAPSLIEDGLPRRRRGQTLAAAKARTAAAGGAGQARSSAGARLGAFRVAAQGQGRPDRSTADPSTEVRGAGPAPAATAADPKDIPDTPDTPKDNA